MFSKKETTLLLMVAVMISSTAGFPQGFVERPIGNGESPVDGFFFGGPVDRGTTKPKIDSTRFKTTEEPIIDMFPTVPTISFGPTSTTGSTPLDQNQFDACVNSCPKTPQYHPVCGTDDITYNNLATLNCSIQCGRDVAFKVYGTCEVGIEHPVSILLIRPKPNKVV